MTLLRKVTLDPAVHMQNADSSFARRGRIQLGAYADITVFDADTIGGTGTVLDSARPSEGIRFVLVNGVVAYEQGQVLGQDAGMLLNRGL
jgi:dihydroorotase